jgi:hypothetical protein
MADEPVHQAQVEAVKEAVTEAASVAAESAAAVVKEAVEPVVTSAADQIGALALTMSRLDSSLDRLADSARPGLWSRIPVALLLVAVLSLQVGLFAVFLQVRENIADNREMIRCALTTDPADRVAYAACIR